MRAWLRHAPWLTLASCSGNANPARVSPDLSTVVATPTDSVLANGLANALVTVTVRDTRGRPLRGARVTLTADGDDNILAQPPPSDAEGRAIGALASLRAGSKTVTVDAYFSTSTVQLSTQPAVRFVGDATTLSPTRSSATVVPALLPADGSSTAVVTVRVRDQFANPLAGQQVQLTANGGSVSFTQPPPTDADGVAAGTLTATTAGLRTLRVTINPGSSAVELAQQPVVEFVGSATALSATRSEVAVSPTTFLANGSAQCVITVTLLDDNGNPVPGVTVSLAATGTANSLSPPSPSNAQGIVTFVLTTTRAEAKSITATAHPSGLPPVVLTQQPLVTSVADPTLLSTTASQVVLNPGFGVAADGASTVGVAITLRDVHGNALPGLVPMLTASGTANTIGAPLATAPDGTTSGTLATTRAETKTVQVAVNTGATVVTLAATPATRFVWPWPATYYVLTTGSDAALGASPATAWRTLQHAAATIGAGATVYVGAGVYGERVAVAASGTASNPIVFVADRDGAHTGAAGEVVVDAGGANEVFALTGDHITLHGFTLRGATAGGGCGVRITGAGVAVTDCRLWGSAAGIRIEGEAAWALAAYSHRRRIRFGVAHAFLPRGFTTAITLDTRVATTPVRLASGNDVRIVWQPSNAAPSELDRIGSAFNTTATNIEFRLQSDLPANAVEDPDGAYFVYYGNAAAGTPPAAEGQVYYFADSFNRADGTVIGNGWSEWTNGGDLELAGGALVIKPTGDTNPPQVGMQQSFPLGAIPSDFRVMFAWTMPQNDESIWSFWGMNVGDAASMTSSNRTTGVGPALYNAESLGTSGVEVIDNDMSGNLETNINGAHTFRADIYLASSTLDYWRDGVLRSAGVSWVNSGTTLSAYRIGADNFGYSAGQEHRIDDLQVVLLASDDPETAAGGEEARGEAAGADARVEGCSLSNHAGAGVVVRRADRTVVRGCLIYNNGGDGFDVGESAAGVVVSGSTFDRNAGAQVRIDGSGVSATLRDNLATGGGAGFVVAAGTSAVANDHNNVFGNVLNWSGLLPGLGDLGLDPLYVDPDGADGVLGGAGGADDVYLLAVLPPSPSLDAGALAARASLWADGSSQGERTTRADGVLDGSGLDGITVNQGFHAAAAVDPLPARLPADLRAAYCASNDRQPQLRRFDAASTTWSNAARALPGGGACLWLLAAASPSADGEELVVVHTDSGAGTSLDTLRFDGTAWRRDLRDPAPPSSTERGFALAYEQRSGDALLVFGDGTNNPRWRTRSAGRWAAASALFATPPGSNVAWVQLAARPGSDEVACVFADTGGALHAVVWNGTAWDEAGSERTLANSVVTVTPTRCFDAVYEQVSGDLLVAWGDPSPSETLGYAVRPVGGAWSVSSLTPARARARIVRLAAEPGSDRIAAALAESALEIEVAAAIWTGSSFTAVAELDATAALGARDIGVAWHGGSAVFVYQDGDGGAALDWATWSAGAGFAVQLDALLLGAGDIQWMTLRATPSQLIALVADTTGQLFALGYAGVTWLPLHAGLPLCPALSATSTPVFALW